LCYLIQGSILKSILRLLSYNSLGLAITFSKNNIMASFSDRRIAIYEVQYKRFYHVKIVGELKVFMASSAQKLCFIDD